ncbi:MAG: CPXCG motif-containing cysteine-rich protein [Planctomycetales bacterium]|nr:CPXCG motif-containing cysteine-rich protein [Planctomycetales bacterium]
MDDEASYICESCGEEIVIPIDLSAGSRQVYVEDCPVCCRSNVIHVECDGEGNSHAWGEREF